MNGGADDSRSDPELLAAIGAGDQRSFTALYRKYAPAVFSFVVQRVADRGLAEEISADVWLGCWRSARAFRGDSQVLTWLLGIAKRQLWSHTRGKRLRTVALDEATDAIPESGTDPSERVIEQASVEDLLAVVKALPPDLSEVVTLAWLHELPYKEIAEITEIPVGTVKSRIFRARRMMRDQLRRNDGRPTDFP